MTYSITLGNKNYAESIEAIKESNKLYLKKNKSKKFSKKNKINKTKPKPRVSIPYKSKRNKLNKNRARKIRR